MVTNHSHAFIFLLDSYFLFAKKRTFIRMISELITTLAQTRKAARITQADLAKRAGLSRMAVQRTETGDVDPRFSTLQEMASVLDMHLMAVPAGLHAQVQALIQSASGKNSSPDATSGAPGETP